MNELFWLFESHFDSLGVVSHWLWVVNQLSSWRGTPQKLFYSNRLIHSKVKDDFIQMSQKKEKKKKKNKKNKKKKKNKEKILNLLL